MGKIPTRTQISAGGVVYRRASERGEIEVALISVGLQNRWQLPKGLVNPGEEPETAAVREVREETGLEAGLEAPLEKIEYWYASRERGIPVRFHKFVHFYLMRYLSGDPSNHDHEVNEARWVPVDRAVEMLAFESEKKVVRMAEERLAGG